ncbi:hypothetical protein BCR34DRAFT_16098 [Clohesyomyces aquaticus]|uniref:Secreted protein n=1 Tax=Clohesyomyces aquaticus TaxID=1231657 RepID=A0A1Y1ZCC1_9PLEO|nr:hypothetical protein BCR34DRAFT_16098 [Clohesyomyces aquaticus]
MLLTALVASVLLLQTVSAKGGGGGHGGGGSSGGDNTYRCEQGDSVDKEYRWWDRSLSEIHHHRRGRWRNCSDCHHRLEMPRPMLFLSLQTTQISLPRPRSPALHCKPLHPDTHLQSPSQPRRRNASARLLRHPIQAPIRAASHADPIPTANCHVHRQSRCSAELWCYGWSVYPGDPECATGTA